VANAQQSPDSIVGQTITYHTSKATEVYLVWGIDNWAKPPAKEFQPTNTFIKRDMAWSKMVGTKDSFSIFVRSPKGTVMNFMFWVTKDSAGRSTDGWDTYGEQTYSSDFDRNKQVKMNDDALWLPSNEFDILNSGWLFAGIAIVLLIFSLFINRKLLRMSLNKFLVGMLFFSVVITVVTRYQMNAWFINNRFAIFGAIFSDLLCLAIISTVFAALLHIVRGKKVFRYIISGIFVLILVLMVFYDLINIRIVEQIGNPLNYQWLYYSDFMNGVDAKSAISHNLTKDLILNLSLLTASILIAGVAFALFRNSISKKIKVAIVLFLVVILAIGFFQIRSIKYPHGKIENPAWALISSSLNANASSKIFSMPVSDSTRQFIEKMHNTTYDTTGFQGDPINNIIVLVLESTPSQYISVYDNSFNVTPNLNKWKSASLIFKNAYAHIPSTPNSMGNIVSGVYPLLSYMSFVSDYSYTAIPSIPNVLGKKGWSSSIFFSSDLRFSKMNEYVEAVGFGHVEDYTTINCDRYQSFENTHTSIDGGDDRCLIERYFKNYDTSRSTKKFSMLWTNQTHYPYVFSGNEITFTKQNKELNRYLNALKISDEAFSLLMDGLVQRNILKNTMVIVVADHGEAFGTHAQYSHATRIYEENVHIPFIFYNPSHFHGTVENGFAGLIDLAPTIAQIAGIKKPEAWQGKSLLSDNSSERTFFISPYSSFLFGTINKRWKYIFNATTNESELYDLANDQGELNNVAGLFPEVVEKEHEVLAAWVQYHSSKLKLWAGSKPVQ
jgi:arylsulfatase A-like enzyme